MNRWSCHALSVHSSDTRPAFLLRCETKDYLFGCPENTTRLFSQNRLSVKKVSQVFLSNLKQEQVGGIHGFIMSADDAGKSSLDIFGPPNLDHYLATGRFYLRRSGCAFTCTSPALQSPDSSNDLPSPIYADTTLTLYGFNLYDTTLRPLKRKRTPTVAFSSAPLGSTSSPEAFEDQQATDWFASVHRDMIRREPVAHLSSPTPAWQANSLPLPVHPRNTQVAWLGITPPIRGKFLPKVAKSLGVKPGPDFSKLTAGQTVMVGDRAVLPEQCMEQGEPSRAFLIVNIQMEHLPSLLSHIPSIKAIIKKHGSVTQFCVHQVPLDIIKASEYQAFMHTFGDQVQHVVCNQDVSPDLPSMSYSTLLQLRLCRIDPHIFSKPSYNSTPRFDLTEVAGLPRFTLAGRMGWCIASHANKKIQICHKRIIDYELDSEQAKAEMAKLSDSSLTAVQQEAAEAWRTYLKHVSSAADELQDASAPSREIGDDLIITTLGTGSAIPSKYRNVSATLVEEPETGCSFLLDAGEGTFGQLARRFGPIKARAIGNSLSFIFISHMHADHHAGLASILAERDHGALKLLVICPRNCITYLREVHQHQSLGFETANAVSFAAADDYLVDKQREPLSTHPVPQNLLSICTVPVEHRARCFGLVVRSLQGWTAVYSGDTKPCKALIDAGRESSLLIHEATMCDGLEESAAYKGHSTFGQALDVAQRMSTKRCLLTHFSQRYPKFPSISVDASSIMPVALAFDNMRMRVGDMWKIAYYNDALKELSRDFDIAQDPGT